MDQKQQRQKEIEKELLVAAIIDAPATFLFALAVYAIFTPEDEVFLPILNNPTVVTSCLLVGGGAMLWAGYKLVMLLREKVRLHKLPG
jgi:hypothetical protein